LIAYPIIGLKEAGLSVVTYVRALEETVIRTVAEYAIEAGIDCGLPGVWVGADKIAAIGVRVGRPAGAAGTWVTSHGLALNIAVDLGWFERIVPCGIADRGVTSIEKLTGAEPSVQQVADRLVVHFGDVFGRRMVPTGIAPLITGS
jgi:lipoyl(octanoyl) transferase